MSFSSEISNVNAESCVSAESSSNELTSLPNEILFKIYDDLGIKDLKELSVTCKSLNSAQIVRGAKSYHILELKRFIQDLIPKLKNVMAMDKFINKFFEDENLYFQINVNNFPNRNFSFQPRFDALYEKSIRKLESMNTEIDLENTYKSDLTNLQDSLVGSVTSFL